MKRVSLTRFRFGGVAAATIAPAWITIYAPAAAAPAVFNPAGLEVGSSGFVKLPRGADVKVADFLSWSDAMRIFLVIQVVPEPLHNRALIAEIPGPIPDEFGYQEIEAFWLEAQAGSAVFDIDTTDGAATLSPLPLGTIPSQSSMLYQVVSGDFDVWSHLVADPATAGRIRRALLGAKHPTSGLGIYIGLLGESASSDIDRYDEYAVSTVTTANGPTIATNTYAWFRLNRAGARFRTFYATAAEPADDDDWIELTQPAATSFTSSDDLRVGLAGFCSNLAAGTAKWKHFRNWTG